MLYKFFERIITAVMVMQRLPRCDELVVHSVVDMWTVLSASLHLPFSPVPPPPPPSFPQCSSYLYGPFQVCVKKTIMAHTERDRSTSAESFIACSYLRALALSDPTAPTAIHWPARVAINLTTSILLLEFLPLLSYHTLLWSL